MDETPGNFEVYYKKSTDGGSTWTTSKRLTWNPGVSYHPAIAADLSGNVHMVWHDDSPGNSEIFYKKSADRGLTWAASVRLTRTSDSSDIPDIAVDSYGSLHVVWNETESDHCIIYYIKSTDGGATWSTAKRLTFASGSSYLGNIAVDSSGNLYVINEDNTPGNSEIYYMQSTDGGATWSTNRRLTWTSGSSLDPGIVAYSSGILHVVWTDDTPGNCDIYYRKCTDGGATWSAIRKLTSNSGLSTFPEIAVDLSGNLHVVWNDYTPGNSEIYYKNSSDSGASWNVQRLTWSSASSLSPSIASDPTENIHVFYEDSTPGNPEIYYRKLVKYMDDSNWGFEETTENDPPADFIKATADFTAKWTTAQKHAGDNGCELVWTSTETQGLVAGFYKPATEGKNVTFRLWGLDNDPAGRFRIGLEFFDANKVSLGTSYSSVYSQDVAVWNELMYSDLAPAGTAFVRSFVRLYDVSTAWAGTATVYIDDWSMAVE
jgi:hypothetical protein